MRISDLSSDVGSSDLSNCRRRNSPADFDILPPRSIRKLLCIHSLAPECSAQSRPPQPRYAWFCAISFGWWISRWSMPPVWISKGMPSSASPITEHSRRSEEHTSELQSLMRISYAVLCLKKKKKNHKNKKQQP